MRKLCKDFDEGKRAGLLTLVYSKPSSKTSKKFKSNNNKVMNKQTDPSDDKNPATSSQLFNLLKYGSGSNEKVQSRGTGAKICSDLAERRSTTGKNSQEGVNGSGASKGENGQGDCEMFDLEVHNRHASTGGTEQEDAYRAEIQSTRASTSGNRQGGDYRAEVQSTGASTEGNGQCEVFNLELQSRHAFTAENRQGDCEIYNSEVQNTGAFRGGYIPENVNSSFGGGEVRKRPSFHSLKVQHSLSLDQNDFQRKLSSVQQQSDPLSLSELMVAENQTGRANRSLFSNPCQRLKHCNSTCNSNSSCSSKCSSPDISIKCPGEQNEESQSAIIDYILDIEKRNEGTSPTENITTHVQTAGVKTVEECMQYLLDETLAGQIAYTSSGVILTPVDMDRRNGNAPMDRIETTNDEVSSLNNTSQNYQSYSDFSQTEAGCVGTNDSNPSDYIINVILDFLKDGGTPREPVVAMECSDTEPVPVARRPPDSMTTKDKCPVLTFILTNGDI